MPTRLKSKSWLAGLAIAAFGGLSAGAEEYPEMKLRMAHVLPPVITGAKVDQWFADEVNRRSGGKIEIEIFWSGSLGGATEILDLVSSGSVPLGATAQGFFPAELPLVGATNSVMMGFETHGQGSRTMTKMVEELDSLKAELRRNNIYPIFFHSLGGYRPFCTSPIETLEDFKGKKIRAWGKYIPKMWESLGATSVNVLPAEVYESLQRGTIDCAFYSHDFINLYKLHEVAKFTWKQHMGALPSWALWIAGDQWEAGLPENVKALMEEVGAEAMERDIAAVTEQEMTVLDTMVADHGVTVVDFKDWDKISTSLTEQLRADWIADMESRGLGDEARELMEFWEANATHPSTWQF